jgi:hypothetical protein
MTRTISILALALFLPGCATVAVQTLAQSRPDVEMSDEMECMTDCLQDASETCESCAGSCLFRPLSESVASAH